MASSCPRPCRLLVELTPQALSTTAATAQAGGGGGVVQISYIQCVHAFKSLLCCFFGYLYSTSGKEQKRPRLPCCSQPYTNDREQTRRQARERYQDVASLGHPPRIRAFSNKNRCKGLCSVSITSLCTALDTMKRTALLIFTIAMVTCNTADTYPTRVVQFTDIADDLAPSNQHGARFEGADLFVTRRTVPACFSALPNYNHNADLVIGTYQMMSNLYSGQHPAPVVLNGSISFSAVHVNGSKYTPETLSVPAGSAVERPAGAFGNMFNHNWCVQF